MVVNGIVAAVLTVESISDIKTKSIYLVDNNTNCVVGIFFVRTYIEDGNLCYEISDVFINRINEGE